MFSHGLGRLAYFLENNLKPEYQWKIHAGTQIRDKDSLDQGRGNKNWKEEMNLSVTRNVKLMKVIRYLKKNDS